LLDADNPGYGTPEDLIEAGREARRLGAALVFARLTTPDRRDVLDARLTAEKLLSFI